jgi:phosphotransferase system HPr (HPr) family protein
MSEATAQRTATIRNREGIHARAATLIADLVRRHDARVRLSKGVEWVEGTDVLQILSLGTAEGETLAMQATGPQAEEVLDALVRLIDAHFNDCPAESQDPQNP